VIEKENLLAAIDASIAGNRRDVYPYTNIHAINLAQRDQSLRDFLNAAHVVYCDGEGVRLGARLLGFHLPPRIVLTYFIWELCRDAEARGYKLFFLGSQTDRVNEAVRRIRVRFPLIRIVGCHHGFIAKAGDESDRVVEMIRAARPDILFVGFGMPLQEKWIAANMHRLEVEVILPCGSMIDYAAGRKSFAPAWMSDHGLEWLYRLGQEPGRLWKRYLIGNPLFLLRVLWQSWVGEKR
jgi:N-acetylglucosaminyldiphosphoundecaprenol N-acetyl-beta-D-mannosaminyltransferase